MFNHNHVYISAAATGNKKNPNIFYTKKRSSKFHCSSTVAKILYLFSIQVIFNYFIEEVFTSVSISLQLYSWTNLYLH